MTNAILAEDHRPSTTEDVRQAILQRTTRGMLTFNTGKVHRLDGELWAGVLRGLGSFRAN